VDILLVEDRILRVRVLTTEGVSRAGVPVALRMRPHDRGRWVHKLSETEPPDGIALFEHLQRRFEQGPGWHATFAFPLVDQPRVPVLEDRDDTEVLDLILPGAGGLEIRVRDAERRSVGGDELELAIEAFAIKGAPEAIWPEGPWSHPRLAANGIARVPWLGLGLHLRVTAKAADPDSVRRPVSVELAGPERDGEIVVCAVTVESATEAAARYPSVCGRLVRRDGTPWEAMVLRVRARTFPYTEHHRARELRVAEGGEFQLLVREAFAEGGRRRYRFATTPEEGGAEIVGWLDLSRELPPGETGVGDVVFDQGPLVVSGRVVDQDGAPVSGARLEVLTLVSKSGRDFWPRLELGGSDVSGSDGSFALYAIPGEEIPPAPLRFRARHRDFPSAEPREFGLGRRDLRFELRAGGALAGSVHLGANQSADDFEVTLFGRGETRYVNVSEDGRFEERALRPGPVRLVVALETLVRSGLGGGRQEIESLEIVPGTTNRDPRIQGIRIEGEAHEIAITVVDREFAPVSGALVTLTKPQPGTHFRTAGFGVARVRTPALPVDLEVEAFGYRIARLKAVSADRRVVLERGLPVLLTTNVTTIGTDPSWRLGVLVSQVDPQTGMQRFPFHRTAPIGGTSFDERGELPLRMPEPGSYLIMPHVVVVGRVASGGGIGMKSLPRITVRDTPELQTFRIELRQDLLDAAIQRYAK
jgi:hypothetical protein